MTFYDAKVNKFGNIEAINDSAGTYSENKSAVLYIGHERSQRTIAFKGFVDNIKVSLDYGISTEQSFHQSSKKIKQQLSKINYTFTLNVPASSVEEAKMNLAKFQELVRYLKNRSLGIGWTGKGINALSRNQSFIYVLFSNIIQNGYLKEPGSLKNVDFETIQNYGARCWMTSINMDPDMELGFFETDGKLIPKAYSINFGLNLFPDLVNGLRSIDGLYERTGARHRTDKGSCWPFGITSTNEIANSYENYNDVSYATDKSLWVGFASIKGGNYVTFKAYVDKFSFSQESKTEELKNPGGTVSKSLLGGGLKSRKFTISLNVPSNSVQEARLNLWKFQELCRYGIKPNAGSGGQTSLSDMTMGQNVLGGTLYAYFQNLISRVHDSSFRRTIGQGDIASNGLECIFSKLELSVESELGFYEFSDGFLAPKAYKISFDLEVNDAELSSRKGDSPANETNLMYGDDSRWLFGVDYTTAQDKDTAVKKNPTRLTWAEFLESKLDSSGWNWAVRKEAALKEAKTKSGNDMTSDLYNKYVNEWRATKESK